MTAMPVVSNITITTLKISSIINEYPLTTDPGISKTDSHQSPEMTHGEMVTEFRIKNVLHGIEVLERRVVERVIGPMKFVLGRG